MKLVLLFTLLLIQSPVKAQFLDNPNCPIGTRFDGQMCVNDYLYEECPQGQYFESVTGQCVSRGPASACGEGYEAITNARGQTRCIQISESERDIQNLENQNSNSQATSQPSPLQLCKSAHSKAKYSCGATQSAGQASTIVRNFQVYRNSGNIKDACGAAKQVASKSAGANFSFALMCNNAVRDCVTKCSGSNDDILDIRSECKDLNKNAQKGVDQSIQDALVFSASSACEKQADNLCVGQNAFADPQCTQFCTKAENSSHVKCLQANVSCNNPNFFQQNAQFCQCLKNPFDKNCANMPMPVTLQNILNTKPTVSSLGLSDQNDFLGNESSGNNKNSENELAKSSGFNGAGGGSNALPSNNADGSTAESLNKDILTNSGGGSAAPGGFFGYGSGRVESTSPQGQASSENISGIDLKAFLPGGTHDPRRNPASNNFEASGITNADGLTNFQKVTRKINMLLLRGELSP